MSPLLQALTPASCPLGMGVFALTRECCDVVPAGAISDRVAQWANAQELDPGMSRSHGRWPKRGRLDLSTI
jgi:hypothetical protein